MKRRRDPILHVTFGARCRLLRKQAGESQQYFANRVGVDRATYGRLERGEGNPTLESIAKIAAGHGLTIAALLEGVAYTPLEE